MDTDLLFYLVTSFCRRRNKTTRARELPFDEFFVCGENPKVLNKEFFYSLGLILKNNKLTLIFLNMSFSLHLPKYQLFQKIYFFVKEFDPLTIYWLSKLVCFLHSEYGLLTQMSIHRIFITAHFKKVISRAKKN